MFEVIPAALEFISKAAITVLAALVAVHFAIQKFKSEALWNRKLEAYTKILESLHYARRDAKNNYDEALKFSNQESQPTYTPEYKAHIEDIKRSTLKAQAEVQKLLDIGTLIISSEAILYLQIALKPRYQDWENDSPVEFWETEDANMAKAIERIKEFARADLGIESTNKIPKAPTAI